MTQHSTQERNFSCGAIEWCSSVDEHCHLPDIVSTALHRGPCDIAKSRASTFFLNIIVDSGLWSGPVKMNGFGVHS